MTKFQWDESLFIGVARIDNQHKIWIERLGNLSETIEKHPGGPEAIRALGFLSEYTEFHFSTEEKHMTEQNYPGLDGHKQRHQELRNTLAALESDFQEEGLTPTLSHAVNTLLLNWLVNHIKTVDSAFGAFLKEKGIVIE